jgi:hypothetical protein
LLVPEVEASLTAHSVCCERGSQFRERAAGIPCTGACIGVTPLVKA